MTVMPFMRPGFILAIAISLLAITSAVKASEPPAPVVFVRYVLSETVPEQLEAQVTTPLQKLFSTIDRVMQIHTSTSHGTIDIEIQFDGGTTEHDMAVIIDQLDAFEFDDEVEVISRSVELLPPRFLLNHVQAENGKDEIEQK